MPHEPPGGWTQNRYRGFGQVVVDDVNVTCTPVPCGDARSGVRVGAVHACAARVKMSFVTAS